MDEERRRNKQNNRDDRDRASGGGYIDVDPLTGYPFYLISNLNDNKKKLRCFLTVIRWARII